MLPTLIILFAFLLGSIPFGLLIAKSQGINIREHGSGNIGATNVLRVVGKKFGISCFFLDFFKGFIPVLLSINLISFEGHSAIIPLALLNDFGVTLDSRMNVQVLHILTALCSILGHNYSPWVGFKGGKGIATSAGALIPLAPFGVLALLVVWFLTFQITRYVSLASIVAAAALPLMILFGSWKHGKFPNGDWNQPLFIFSLFIAVMAIWKHRSNIKNLLNGSESKFIRKEKNGPKST